MSSYLDAGRGLAAAHEAGLVHGDFTPTNLMFTLSLPKPAHENAMLP